VQLFAALDISQNTFYVFCYADHAFSLETGILVCEDGCRVGTISDASALGQ